MEEVYYLKVIMQNGEERYMGHTTYSYGKKPTYKDLMPLQSAKAKRTKMLADMEAWIAYKPEDPYMYKDVVICQATITYGDEIEF